MSLHTLRGRGPAPAGFVTCHDPKCPARRNPFGRWERTGRHYHPAPPPSAEALAEASARLRVELTAILARYGFETSEETVARLQAEGMGPHELEYRVGLAAREVGGLTYTHGIAKREGAS